jgi:hypothetical protein
MSVATMSLTLISLLGALAVLIAFLSFVTGRLEQWFATVDEQRLTRALVLWTAVLAIATFAGAIVADFTLSAIRGQLLVMEIDKRISGWSGDDQRRPSSDINCRGFSGIAENEINRERNCGVLVVGMNRTERIGDCSVNSDPRAGGDAWERAIRYADREYGVFDEIELEPYARLDPRR